jgi:sulfopropanediol 3-dehydrogenase
MAKVLKAGRDVELIAEQDATVRAVVEKTLADIAERGDAAVRELSVKFDKWDRDSYRLEKHEIEACLAPTVRS